ncbi:MAG: MBOAT family protein [Clostridia bacterium]|nr:MBOAT family protein [Clostridia bacterium]
MLFSSTLFIYGFLPAVLLLYYAVFKPFLKKMTYRNVLLFAASIFFYAWGEPRFVFVMLLSIAANWYFALMITKYRETPRARLVLIFTLVFNLGIIFIFKYLMFFCENINVMFGAGLKVPVIDLPIGISFFTFQSISYVVDVYRKKGRAQKNILNVGLYIAFFPQLIAGPIVRYQTVAAQIMNRKETLAGFSYGFCRFVAGLAKKVLIANQMAPVADAAFSGGGPESVMTAWLGALAYTLQIYFDFSGYSDMAIGLGQMFGFKFLENFNYPYISKSITEFWRRWHMSLGTWFRDYVYIPMGGSRVESRIRLIINLFVVWLLTGVWHGASWNFIVWGLYYLVFLVMEKMLYPDALKNASDSPPKTRALWHLYTMAVVVFGWVIFRADTLAGALSYMGAMFGGAGVPFVSDDFLMFATGKGWYLILGAVLSCPLAPYISEKLNAFKEQTAPRRALSLAADIIYPAAYAALLLLCTAFLLKNTYNPFIYFNF